MRQQSIDEVLNAFPKQRPILPDEYKAIYDKHFYENRNGLTSVTKASSQLEKWLHYKAAQTVTKGKTLEIGAGSLNQFDYEKKLGIYDIVEPYHLIYEHSKYIHLVDHFYDDISEIDKNNQYDRIISIATFEHILNLPEVVYSSAQLLTPDGVLAVSIPNEGRFLWKFAYTNTTGREFRKRYGLDYNIIMAHEHVNSADEIETILRHNYKDVKYKLFGISKELSFYRFYICRCPIKH